MFPHFQCNSGCNWIHHTKVSHVCDCMPTVWREVFV